MKKQHGRNQIRLGLESLEDRALLSTCTVTNLGDTGAGASLAGDLRYCINLSNNSTEPSTRIEFAPGLPGRSRCSKGTCRF